MSSSDDKLREIGVLYYRIKMLTEKENSRPKGCQCGDGNGNYFKNENKTKGETLLKCCLRCAFLLEPDWTKRRELIVKVHHHEFYEELYGNRRESLIGDVALVDSAAASWGQWKNKSATGEWVVKDCTEDWFIRVINEHFEKTTGSRYL